MQRTDVDGTGETEQSVQHRGEVQAMTEEELRSLTSKNNEVHAVYDRKIVSPAAIGHLRNHAIVHVLDKLTGEDKSDSKWLEWSYCQKLTCSMN